MKSCHQLTMPRSERIAANVIFGVILSCMVAILFLAPVGIVGRASLFLLLGIGFTAILALSRRRMAKSVTFRDEVTVYGFLATKRYPKLLGWSWFDSDELNLRFGPTDGDTWTITATKAQVIKAEECLRPELFEVDVEPDMLDEGDDDQNRQLLKLLRLQHYRDTFQ